ncbi:MAG: hypothetical protein M5U28_03915 [Sandaracinaceae bacterium]|nr:hypothetical protein [Sandaracinaceae bacterium]
MHTGQALAQLGERRSAELNEHLEEARRTGNESRAAHIERLMALIREQQPRLRESIEEPRLLRPRRAPPARCSATIREVLGTAREVVAHPPRGARMASARCSPAVREAMITPKFHRGGPPRAAEGWGISSSTLSRGPPRRSAVGSAL